VSTSIRQFGIVVTILTWLGGESGVFCVSDESGTLGESQGKRGIVESSGISDVS
jgi:hypothetical protein